MVCKVCPDLLDHLETKALLETMVQMVNLVNPAQGVHQEPMEMLDNRVCLELLDQGVWLEKRVKGVHLVKWECKVTPGPRVKALVMMLPL